MNHLEIQLEKPNKNFQGRTAQFPYEVEHILIAS